MVLKFHMQHDEAAGLQKDKIQTARELKMAAGARIAKPFNQLFSSEPLDTVYLAETLYRTLGQP